MASSKILVVVKLPTTDAHLRNELFERLLDISEHARDNEPGTLKYAILIPREDDGKTAWVIEEYTDQKAYDTHMASQEVTDINQWFNTVPIFNQSNLPVLRNLSHLPDAELTRLDIFHHKDPHILYTEVPKSEKSSPSPLAADTHRAKHATDAVKEHEPGTLIHAIFKDLEEDGWYGALEAYESEKYHLDVHENGEAASKMRVDMGTTAVRHKLKLVGGYLYK